MPSSSNRNTYVERALFGNFRVFAIHLHISSLDHENGILAEAMAKALDIDEATLMDSLTPVIKPHQSAEERIDIMSAAEAIEKLEHYSAGKKQSVRIFKAGRACIETSELLQKVGRADEAEDWGAFGDELWKMADEEMAKEDWRSEEQVKRAEKEEREAAWRAAVKQEEEKQRKHAAWKKKTGAWSPKVEIVTVDD